MAEAQAVDRVFHIVQVEDVGLIQYIANNSIDFVSDDR